MPARNQQLAVLSDKSALQNPNPGSEPKRHHYIPQFYLRQWCGSDGQFCEYSRPYTIVKPRRIHPKATGYEKELYAGSALPETMKTTIETEFFGRVDQEGSDMLRRLKSASTINLSSNERLLWARFLISLTQRNPEKVAWLAERWPTMLRESVQEMQSDYDILRKQDWPITFEEFKSKIEVDPLENSGILTLPSIINLPQTCAYIANMQWNIVTFSRMDHTLLTSDRPVIMTNGLDIPGGYIAMPLGPHHLFVGMADQAADKTLKSLPPRALVMQANNIVASQAKKYVYGRDDSQLRFVENRLGRYETQMLGRI